MITTLYRLYAGSFVMGARTLHGKSTFVCEPPTCAVFLIRARYYRCQGDERNGNIRVPRDFLHTYSTIVPVLPRDLLRAGARW